MRNPNHRPSYTAFFQILLIILSSWCMLGVILFMTSGPIPVDPRHYKKPKITCAFHPTDAPYLDPILSNKILQNRTRYLQIRTVLPHLALITSQTDSIHRHQRTAVGELVAAGDVPDAPGDPSPV